MRIGHDYPAERAAPGEVEEAILDVLRHYSATARRIAGRQGLKLNTVRSTLPRMERQGLVVREGYAEDGTILWGMP